MAQRLLNHPPNVPINSSFHPVCLHTAHLAVTYWAVSMIHIGTCERDMKRTYGLQTEERLQK